MQARYVLGAGMAAVIGLTSHAALAGKANDTLVYATDKEVNTAIPPYNNLRETVIIGHNVWDGLIYRDPETFEYKPLLATSYKWVDPLTMEFELRRGVKFHDGSDFDADDVVSTVNHLARPDSGVLSKVYYEWMKSAEKIDDHKVRLRLANPFPGALEMLSGPIVMFPAGIWDKAKKDAAGKPDYGTVPTIGTGPYKIAEIVQSQSIKMVRNDAYYDGPKPKPKIKNLTFRTITDKETQIAELLTGGVDWIWDVAKEKAEDIKAMPGVQVVNADTMRVSYISMDAAGRAGDTPFKDIRVRKAIAHAIDRDSIVKNLVGGAARVVHSACYPTQFGCTDEVPKYEYNPQKAKQLLAEAGHPNGFSTDIYAYRERHYTEAVMGYLAAVGIKTSLKFMQYQALRQIVWDGKAPLAHMTWGSSSVNDVSAFTSLFFNGERDDYCRDPEIIAALKEGDTSVDPEVRKLAYKKALVKIQELACWLPMFTYSKYYVFSDKLNFKPPPDEVPAFYTASWK